MARLWARIIIRQRIAQQATVPCTPDGVDEALTELCREFDIPCPLCREKYGSADGKLQEKEGPAIARAFLKPLGFDDELIERAAWLVGHHHTYTDVDGLDHQILLEADFLVNAHEQQLPRTAVENMGKTVFQTAAGKQFLKTMYLG